MAEETENNQVETVTESKTVEMTREEFAKRENDLQNGKTDKLPDGRTIKEVQNDLLKIQEQQRQELLEKEEKKRAERAKENGAESEKSEPEKVTVTVNPTGAMFASPITTEPPPPDSDLPQDFPGRKALIAAEIGFETAKAMSKEDLVQIAGIGEATADAIISFGTGQ